MGDLRRQVVVIDAARWESAWGDFDYPICGSSPTPLSNHADRKR